ncbi:MAG TPA: UDP-N-acetylmuramoyl-tripeptide--D-alanyl-D-alanine ligase [Anaerolineales bacterium]|nr:UDP-N-acetylmuramoyl-tripeptide--D-alanyl-D-alanine ligase [Anaerolineales bacterium]
MLTLTDLVEALTDTQLDLPAQVITDAVVDSRQVIPGCLFIAIPGKKVDGHDFIESAFQQGASFALIEHEVDSKYYQVDLRQPPVDLVLNSDSPICLRVKNSLEALQEIARFWRSKLDIRVIGITGSVGKSTSKELIAEVLSERYRTLRSPGNLNNEIGLPLTILKLGSGYERAVLEMGFYVPGEIKFLCDIAKPQVGIVTNIGTVHAERAGSIDVIAAGKSELVQELPPSPEGIAILNYDDPLVRSMADITSARVFYYGLDPKADLWADQIQSLGLDGIQFCFHYEGESLYVKIPMIGQHSVHTALRAAAVGLVEGLSWPEIIQGFLSGHAQIRLVAVRSRKGALIIDDTYNASPESTIAALNLLADLNGRKLAVLGDMLELGQYEKQGHGLVGVRAAEVADELITVGERAHEIAKSASLAGFNNDRIHEFNANHEVIDFLDDFLQPDDSVLIKGSHGMHMEEIVAALEDVS